MIMTILANVPLEMGNVVWPVDPVSIALSLFVAGITVLTLTTGGVCLCKLFRRSVKYI